MIRISDNFKTDDKKLAALYEGAKSSLMGGVKQFGDYCLAVRSSEDDRVSAATEIMSAETLARYDIETALECVRAFLATLREDGRMAGEIVKKQDGIFCDYSRLSGFCIAEEALSLFYMSKKKELTYLGRVYDALKRFDGYLWNTHDCNRNGFLELFSEKELAYGVDPERYTPVKKNEDGEVSEISPFPVETGLFNAFAYRLKRTLGQIAEHLKNGEAEKYSIEADRLFEEFKKRFWSEESAACYDRDYRGEPISYLGMENLFMMYYGAFDKDMAESFVNKHLINPDEFFTKFPLPEIPADLGGMVWGATYRKMIKALERYGFNRELAAIGEMVLGGLCEMPAFTELYDPGTCEPIKKNVCADYVPTATAVIELIARFYGVSLDLDRVIWGAKGHNGESTSEYSFGWGSDTYSVFAERETSSGFINGKLLFTVTNGVKVVTDWFGDEPEVLNITSDTIDCIFVYRDRTYSFTLEPNGVWTPQM